MSDLTSVKRVLSDLLHCITQIEKVGDLNKATAFAQSRFDRMKEQEDELRQDHADLLFNAKARAAEIAEVAQREIAAQRAHHERAVASVKEHAVAELENIQSQRHRLDDEIEALKAQARELRSLVEASRQELAGVNDALTIAKTAHDGVKKQLAELKQAL